MRKLTTLILSILIAGLAFGKSVTQDQAQQVANNYYVHFSGKSDLKLIDSYSHSYNGITTYYVFNYSEGGFVVMSADDAVTPVLAQSGTGYFDINLTLPSVQYWFDSYDKEIAHIIAAKYDNTATLAEWNKIQENDFPRATNDVGPLLTTTWDQGCYYNTQTPTVSAPGTCNHSPTGCVATTMSQIEKYHSFPAHGYLSHSYVHPTYGQQSANFGTTTYNWSAMGNNITSANTNVATIMYQNGVAVDMDYGIDASGAFSESVPYALTTYFNYDPTTISLEEKANYTTTGWKSMLMAELDNMRPIYYSGDDGTSGHAWVCDGYRTSDSKFHMNWGWSGMYNGYFAIGSLNAGGYTPNSNNKAVIGIKPGNPNLVVRFTNIFPNQAIGFGSTFNVECSVLDGTATAVSVFVDGAQVYTTPQGTFTFPWNTGTSTLGSHVLSVQALNATDTAYHAVTIGLSEWIPQASGFATASRGVKYLCAVDTLTAWGTAYDGVTTTNYIQEWTRTSDGGNTWVTGVIPNCAGLEPAMIFAVSDQVAYCPMYKQTGSKPQGIYATFDGGTTWNRQTTATFSNSASFPNVVHFFNSNDGFCMGDPISGDFEIYTTSNGGTTWTQVPGNNIINPVSGEFGIVGYYSAVGDNAWFGTNKGRIYRSADKGLHWEAATATLGAKYVDIKMADALHGIAQDKDQNSTGALAETFDGGVSWANITVAGQVGTNDYCFVPGTENTWVSTEANSAVTLGSFYSFDGGHSWSHFDGTEVSQYLAVDFVNNTCGWAGGFNESATVGGIFKYVSVLEPGQVLNTVTGLAAQVSDNSVHLSWNTPAPGGTLVGFNVYRNDTLLLTSPIAELFYHDYPVANGKQTYCVTAVYDNGESAQVCVDAWVTVGVPNTDPAAFKVYPNPTTDVINIITPVQFTQVRMTTLLGQEVYNYSTPGNNLRILTDGFEPGIYVLQIYADNKLITRKISIK
ncbi:MAG: C10 family peptidase [Bacteroidales bacterium]|nr:C10 family peptidase [Bacteroidales bacterium]